MPYRLRWLLYAVIRRSPRRWWLYFWLATLPMIVAVMYLEPMIIEPMFYHFQPLGRRILRWWINWKHWSRELASQSPATVCSKCKPARS